MCGREQFEDEGHTPAANRRVDGKAEHVQHAKRNRRPGFGLIIDRHARAGRRFEMRRRLASKPFRYAPRPPSSIDFSMRRMIFPEGVMGTLSTNWTARGTL